MIRLLPNFLLYIVFLIFTVTHLHAQDSLSQERPKIGLALSGGAAKGFAHIGVIKYLEELGIQVDYITGTSMGSIVGGLHAMGYNSDKMTEVASSQDWSTLLSGYIPLKDVAPLEKVYHQKFPFYFSYDKGEVSLPQGVINSQKLDLILSGLFSPAYHINDFDELRIPFRCVAVNIENGNVKVFNKGSLSRSIRASMAIPMVFNPEEIDGQLYVDGGLIRNYPVQEVIDMGADFVIGVFVGSELESKDQLNTMFDIFSQSTFMMSSLDSEEQSKLVNIQISPDVKSFNSFGFEESTDIIRRGYHAAQAKEKDLVRLAEKLKSYQSKKPPKALPIPEYLLMNEIELPETDKPYDDLAKFKFGRYRLGSLSIDRIDKGISRIAGTNLYDKVSYAFNHFDNRVGIDVFAKPKKSVLLSGSINSFGTTNTSFIIHTSMYNTLAKLSSLKLTARISEFLGVQGSFQNRIGQHKNLVINFIGKYNKMESPLYQSGERQNQYNEMNSDLALYFGFEPNNVSYIEIGGGLQQLSLRQKNLAFVDIKNYKNFHQFLELNGELNNLDRTQFPRNGYRAKFSTSFVFGQDIDLSYVGSQELSILRLPPVKNYVRSNIEGLAVFSIFDVITSETRVRAGYKSQSSLLNNFKFGGLLQTSEHMISFVGIEVSQLHYDEFLSFRQDLRVNIFGPVYVSAIVNYVNGNRTFLPELLLDKAPKDFFGYGGGIYLKTPVGPLSLELGRTTEVDEFNFSLGLGYRYIN